MSIYSITAISKSRYNNLFQNHAVATTPAPTPTPTPTLAILYLPSTPSDGVFPFRAVLPRVSVRRAQPPLTGYAPQVWAFSAKAGHAKEENRQRLEGRLPPTAGRKPPTAAGGCWQRAPRECKKAGTLRSKSATKQAPSPPHAATSPARPTARTLRSNGHQHFALCGWGVPKPNIHHQVFVLLSMRMTDFLQDLCAKCSKWYLSTTQQLNNH